MVRQIVYMTLRLQRCKAHMKSITTRQPFRGSESHCTKHTWSAYPGNDAGVHLQNSIHKLAFLSPCELFDVHIIEGLVWHCFGGALRSVVVCRLLFGRSLQVCLVLVTICCILVCVLNNTLLWHGLALTHVLGYCKHTR